jgi:fructose-specific phosphotransferase system IIC component
VLLLLAAGFSIIFLGFWWGGEEVEWMSELLSSPLLSSYLVGLLLLLLLMRFVTSVKSDSGTWINRFIPNANRALRAKDIGNFTSSLVLEWVMPLM